ncbi:MAG: AsmA family protein [Burkholderiales bacterium]
MKIVKIALYGLLGLVVLALLGLGAAVMIVDGAFVKSRLEREMKEKNRTLQIEGTPALRLFPVAGIVLGKTSLSEPGSGKPFIALESAEVAVRVMPLLSGEVAVETLKLSGLRANVVRRKDGSMNFSDLAGGAEKASDKAAEAPKLRIAEVNVSNVQIAYHDEATGQQISVVDLDLKTGRLDGQTPGEVSLSARITGRKPEIDLRAQASGALLFNIGREQFAFDKFIAQLKGRLDQDTLAAEFSAPRMEITPSKASGSEVKGSVQIKGPQRSVNARLLIASVEGSATALSIPKILLDLDAAVSGISTKARLEAALRVNLPKQDLETDVAGKLDDSTLKAKVALTNFAPLKAAFDLSVDRLNVDRYLPPERKEARAEERIDLSALKGKTVTGKLAIGALTVKRAKLENLKAEVKLADGKLEIAPYSANLYGGTLGGALSVDANGNKVQLKESAQNVALGALLRDVAQKDMLEGRGNVTADLQTAGPTPGAMRKALAGNARVQMKDGAIKGINLAESARNAKAALGGKQAKADPSQKTDFSEAGATFNIKNGVARNDDLKVQSPFLRIGGAGNLDIGNNGIDYLAKATLAATSRGQGGRDAQNVTGVTVPVKLYGALDNPSWSVDYSAILGGAAGGVTETVKKGASSVGDAVRGLFKR